MKEILDYIELKLVKNNILFNYFFYCVEAKRIIGFIVPNCKKI